MAHKSTLMWALALIVMGLIGMGALLVFFGGSASLGEYSSNGQRIYYTGANVDGRPIPRTTGGAAMMGRGAMGAAACVDCHGEDGRGGGVGMMFRVVEIPDIRYSALTSAQSEDGTTVPAWTDSDIARAIREGVEPDGQRIKAPMPRWDMTDAELDDVIAYLKELDRR